MMSAIQWLIQNVFYPYPELSLVTLGGVALILGYLVFRRCVYWFKFSRSKRKAVDQIQQHLQK